jgi:hypothetical protein
MFCNTHGQNTYQSQTNLDGFNVKNATNTIADLEKSIESITKQLYELDDTEITMD